MILKPAHHNAATDANPEEGLIKLSQVAPQNICWRWPNRIPRGMVTVIAGPAKSGKSLVTCAFAAIITSGSRFPLGEGTAKRGHVVILNNEDDPSLILRPRLTLAGADLTRVHIPLGNRVHDLAAFLKTLEAEIRPIKRLRAVIIDPMTSVVSIGRNNADHVRALLTGLGHLAARRKIAVLVVVHLNKAASGRATSRVAGSFEWTAACRAAHLVDYDPVRKRHVFLPWANNVGLTREGLSFRIRQKAVDGGKGAYILWDDAPVLTSAEQLIDGGSKRYSVTTHDAMKFLRRTVRKATSAKTIIRMGKQAGFTPKELRVAREQLGIKSTRVGGLGAAGKWVWVPGPDRKIA